MLKGMETAGFYIASRLPLFGSSWPLLFISWLTGTLHLTHVYAGLYVHVGCIDVVPVGVPNRSTEPSSQVPNL